MTDDSPLLSDLISQKLDGVCASDRRSYTDVARDARVHALALRRAHSGAAVRKRDLDNILTWLGPEAAHATYPEPLEDKARHRPKPPTPPRDPHTAPQRYYREELIATKLLAHIASGGVLEDFDFFAKEGIKGDRLHVRVGKWLKGDKKFREDFAAAKLAASYLLMEQIIPIADGTFTGVIGADMKRTQLMLETRFRLAALLNPQFNPSRQAASSQGGPSALGFGDTLEKLERKKPRSRAKPKRSSEAAPAAPSPGDYSMDPSDLS